MMTKIPSIQELGGMEILAGKPIYVNLVNTPITGSPSQPYDLAHKQKAPREAGLFVAAKPRLPGQLVP